MIGRVATLALHARESELDSIEELIEYQRARAARLRRVAAAPAALPLPPDRRLAPLPAVSEARNQLARAAALGTGGELMEDRIEAARQVIRDFDMGDE
jgi:hypothetical protein